MKKYDLLTGFITGIVAAIAGTIIFLEAFTPYGVSGILLIKRYGMLGQVLTLGSILNLIVFFIVLQQKRNNMANGIILATVTLAILTLLL